MPRSKPPAPTTATDKKTTRTRKSAPADRTLWEHVASSVTPLKGKRKAAATTHEPTPPVTPQRLPLREKVKPKSTVATPQRSTRDVAVRAVVTPMASTTTRTTAGFDRATESKLRKGQLEIEGRIDLHGMTQDEAYRALARFIARAYGQRQRTLLVITGKGRVSQGGGVLRRLLPLWVSEADMKICVLACTPAAIKDGGDGAFYLRLRKKTS